MIICLGWGSLIWQQGELDISGEWRKDGPEVPVEFLRQSINGRLTLVIEPSSPKLMVLWAMMQTDDIDVARENLRKREGNTKKEYIGVWTQDIKSPENIPDLANWAKQIGATAVIWTALPAKFDGDDFRKPTLEEAIAYLEQLDQTKKELAEEYIRKVPQQISTRYRAGFESYFGWVPQSAA